jgi:N-acetyl-anhydromuramyl-L-alanine amidase AmpD
VAEIQAFWKNNLGWKSPGYHRIIEPNGNVVSLLDYGRISNGVSREINAISINISYIGGIDRTGKPVDNRTPAQLASMVRLVKELRAQFPTAKIVGHRDFSPDKNGNGIIEFWEYVKACPCFDVSKWLKDNGII